MIAPYVKKIVGIEESFSAVEDAKENSKKFSNIEYLLGKTEDILESYTENIDVLILDPPRIGCDEKVIKIIKDIKPKKIILISCSPENFAIDISRLIKDNIICNAIAPGPFPSQMLGSAVEHDYSIISIHIYIYI